MTYSLGLNTDVVRRPAGLLLPGFVIAGILGAGCAQRGPEPAPIPALFPAAFTDTTLEFPRVVFADGTVSINDKCPVRKVRLNHRLSPLYVNGPPVGFC